MRGKELRRFAKENLTDKERQAVEAVLKEDEYSDIWDVNEVEDGVLVGIPDCQLMLYKDGKLLGLNPNNEKHAKYFDEKSKYLDRMRPSNWEQIMREITHPEEKEQRLLSWLNKYEAGCFNPSDEVKEKAKLYKHDLSKIPWRK